MRKLESDIRRATRRYKAACLWYEKTREALQDLTDLQEAARLDGQGIKPNLERVRQYGAYLSGVQRAVGKILHDKLLGDNARKLSGKDGRLCLVAELELVMRDKVSADRWIGGYPNMRIKAVAFDKKGKPTKYEATWYVRQTIDIEI